MEKENVELTELKKTLYDEVLLNKNEYNDDSDGNLQFSQLKKENEQLKTLNRQLISMVPSSKNDLKNGVFIGNLLKISRNKISDKTISNLKGTVYIHKMSTFMEHLNFS